jgi:hypothetical protein
MTREQAIEWAKQTGLMDHDDADLWADELTDLCRLAREDMREECAKVCDDRHSYWYFGDGADSTSGPKECAEAIRNLEV